MVSALIFVLIGLAAGLAAGLGVGGGAILIPLLTLFAGLDQQTAQGINLLYFLPTALIAVIIHRKNKKINKRLVLSVGLYGVAGAFGGAFLAMAVKPDALRTLFGYFLLAIGLYELFGKEKALKEGTQQKETDVNG